MRTVLFLVAAASLTLSPLAALAQNNADAPVNNGHLQPTRESVTDAFKADDIKPDKSKEQQRLEQETRRMERVDTICSNCSE